MIMKWPWVRGREEHKRLDEADAFLDDARSRIREQAPRVNTLVGWLEERKLTNGFGDDFEFTLANPRRPGG